MLQNNPFLTEGYLSPEYFCDRVEETALLTRHLTNGCNVALIAPRRMGKSGLIYNCFNEEEIRNNYHCIYIDIYETKNLNEFVYVMGKGILRELKSQGRKVWESFLNIMQSLKSTITFDINGNPEWNVGLGDIASPDITLDEIFEYLNHADKPCIVAIDEFQTIASYPEKTVEAALRKRIQNCHNAKFVFSGSKRHMMALMFASESRPFYNSSSIMGLEPINKEAYFDFANHHLSKINRSISRKAFEWIYQSFDGITWYIQYILNMLYTHAISESTITTEDAKSVMTVILSHHRFVYESLLFQLSPKQKQVLLAIANEGNATGVTSQAFLQKYKLGSSTVQGAIKVLTERDFISYDNDSYQVSDRFFREWIIKRF